MGIFDKMKAAVGIGGTKIKIIFNKEGEDNENPSYEQGEPVIGKLQITGGNTEQTINELHLQLKVRWTEIVEEVTEYADGHTEVVEEEDTNTKVLDEIVDTEPFQVTEGFQKELDFEFPLPYDADISVEGELSYYLYARADIPGAIDARDKASFDLIPSYEIQAVEHVLEEEFGFECEAEYSEEGWVVAEFVPTGDMADVLEVLNIRMKNGEEELRAEIVLDMDDRVSDDKTFRVAMPYEQIVPGGQEADLKKIAEIFKGVFADLKWI